MVASAPAVCASEPVSRLNSAKEMQLPAKQLVQSRQKRFVYCRRIAQSEMLEAGLLTLPPDVLQLLVAHLAEADTRSVAALGCTCSALRKFIAQYRNGESALPLSPRLDKSFGRGVDAIYTSDGVRLRKNNVAGDGIALLCVVPRCIATYWEFEIERFRGRRIELGLTTKNALRFGSIDRRESWSFDCFGRANVAGMRRTYGRQMKEGDVVGIVYDIFKKEMYVLDNGVPMGALPVHNTRGGELYPYVYLPYYPDESVVVRRGTRVPRCLKTIAEGVKNWRKPDGLPYDGRLIVSTWNDTVWYAVPVTPDTTTIEELWLELAVRQSRHPDQLDLIHNGRHLVRSTLTLHQEGIVVDNHTGTYAFDVLVTIPHLVS